MSFLQDSEILIRIRDFFPEHHSELVQASSKKQLQPSSFELRLGEEVYLSADKDLVRLGNELGRASHIKIRPGEFAILMTLESVNIPVDMMALISMKNTFKSQGLINISGFHVDPGFHGNLHFSVYNAGPGDIILRYNEPVFVIFFAELMGRAANPYNGDHKDQSKISSKAMNLLTGKSVSPLDLSERLTTLELTTRIQWGLLVALTVGLLGAIIKGFAK